MAKYLENENESPEVDLKNMTVKLAGMGFDDEIESHIPGKKEKKGSKAKKEAEEKASEIEEKAEDIEEKVEESIEEAVEEVADSDIDDEISSEVEEYYRKKEEEKNLTLEKVEQLESEMASSGETKKQKLGALDTVIAKEKKVEEPKILKERKKANFDAVTICAIVLAILALGGGVFYLVISTRREPSLKITEQDFRVNYLQCPIYKSILDFGFLMGPPTYRDENPAFKAQTNATADPTAITTVMEDKYRYYDGVLTNSLLIPVYYTGKECKDTQYIKSMRFYAPVADEDEVSVVQVFFGAVLQSLYSSEDSQACYDKIKNAYAQSSQSAMAAVIITDGDYAYAVSKNEIEGEMCIVLDVIPAKEANKYVFYNSIFV